MDRLKFILAGNATFTIVSKKTGARFTYRVLRRPLDTANGEERYIHFVSVLTGPDTYKYLGTVFNAERYAHGKSSQINVQAPSAQAFAWFWSDVETTKVDFYHAGKCGRCGRELTVPESIESGLGPECVRRAG